jgi:DNA-binding IclR family transcriptional regulator
VFLTLVFATVYRVLSGGRIGWGYVWYGSFIAAVLFTIGKTVLSYFPWKIDGLLLAFANVPDPPVNATLVISEPSDAAAALTAAERAFRERRRPFGLDVAVGRHPSVDRAIRVLTALQGARRMTLSELAARLELPPSTVHGLVKTLVQHGMVVQEHGSSRYQLGPAVLRLGNVYLDTLELRSKAIPWAEDLARRTGMAVRSGVLLLDDVVIIHHEPRPDGSRQMPEVGIVIPAHACALGKALLAFDPDGWAETLAGDQLRRSMTGETITDSAALRAELEAVRATGIATEVEEAVLGECGAAAPLADAAGETPGAIGLVVPSAEWPLKPGALDALRTTARAVSRELGAPGWPPPAPTWFPSESA